ncbi:MAG TPA: hypothetical protein VJM76_06610, partial [Gammaproteobacteria bacterium]|nr:hypothetical protein [Gammaproteobacteria bacterium]
NWTAVGLPGHEQLPIVDPRGLVTPFWDGWSLDAWVVTDDKRELIPALSTSVKQYLDMNSGIAVITESVNGPLSLQSRVEVILQEGATVCRQAIIAAADCGAWLVITLRPYNPEGVSFIHDAKLIENNRAWSIDNGKHSVEFSAPVDRYQFSNYRYGDVRVQLPKASERDSIKCDVGMVTAAAMFKLEAGIPRRITVHTPLIDSEVHSAKLDKRPFPSWPEALTGHTILNLPDAHFQFLYEAALRTLILHSPSEVYAGPYTYKRFWFRDAAFILHAMLCVGLHDRAEHALQRFSERQTHTGYFLSQDGEWDSNGEALWIMQRFRELTGRALTQEQVKSAHSGAHWIIRKRLSDTLDKPHAGLLPAGFSAEHLGPNDYYYWDDFWAIAGLNAAAELAEQSGAQESAAQFRQEAVQLMAAIERSLKLTAKRRDRAGIPASPYRRMDGGAIGSIVASYPLNILPADDPRLLETVNFLLSKCFVDGGFFQDMIHSGINMYLTLHVAQVLLRAGDPRCLDLMRAVAELASPTGQWPEAIHPRTHGGCMGDGQHAWAAAEWIMMLRNCFVREEQDRLILASGIFSTWLSGTSALSFGPAPTRFGAISITITPGHEHIDIRWEGQWRTETPMIEIRCPGFAHTVVAASQTCATLTRSLVP